MLPFGAPAAAKGLPETKDDAQTLDDFPELVQTMLDATAPKLEALLNGPGTRTPDVVVQIDAGDEPLVIEASGGRVHAHTGATAEPDAILHGPPDAILGVVMGFLEPGSKRGRKVTIEGDTAALDRLREGRSLG